MEGCSCSHHYCHQLRDIRNRTMLSVAPPMANTERTLDLITPVMTSVAPIRAQSFPSGHQLMNNQSLAITPISKDLLAVSLSFTDRGQTTVVKCSTQSSKLHHISPTVISANLKSEQRTTVKPTASLLFFRSFASNCESSTVQYCCYCPYFKESGKAPAGYSVPDNASHFSGVSKDNRTLDGGGMLLNTSPTGSSLLTLSLKSSLLSPHNRSEQDKDSLTSSNTFFPATRSKNTCCLGASHLAAAATTMTTKITAATTTSTINNENFSDSPALEDKKQSTENISLASLSSPLTTRATTLFPGLSSQSSSSSLSPSLSALCSLLLTKPRLFASLSTNLSSFTTTIASHRQTVAWQPQRLLLLLLGLLTLLSVAGKSIKTKTNRCNISFLICLSTFLVILYI